MAKRKSKAKQKIIWRLEAAAAVLLVCGCLCITFLGGRYNIPTWQQLFRGVGISNVLPLPGGDDESRRPGGQPTSPPADEGDGSGDSSDGRRPSAVQPTQPPAGTGQSTAAGETQLHFIDVGQGDAVLIANGGEYALIDCGTEECEVQLLGYLEQMGITRIKLLVMTHPHADHIGSMDAVLEAVKVDTLLLPDLTKAEQYPTTACFERVLTAAGQNGCAVQTAYDGAWYTVGGGTLTVLSTGIQTDNYNNISLCTRYTAGGFAFVDTGDAELPVEELLLRSGQPLSAAVFKAAHHGSGTSNSLAFLEAINPKVVVVSCGVENSYGHPHEQPMDNYISVDADIYRTDEQGSVVITHSPTNGLQVYTTK